MRTVVRLIAAIALTAVLVVQQTILTFALYSMIREPSQSARIRPEGDFVDVGGMRIHYIARGTGRPLVLVHGFGAWSFSWRKNIPALSRRFRVYALDLKGFGLSDKPPGRGYTLDSQASLLEEFMNRLGIEKAIIAGNSMGGEIGMRLYASHPEKVAGLVLLNSTGYQMGPDGAFFRLPDSVRTSFIRNFGLSRWLVKAQLLEAFADGDRAVTPDVVEGYFLPLQTPGAEEASLGAWKELRLEDETSTARSIRVPTLIIWGAADRIVPKTNAYRFKEDIPGSSLIILENVGHAPQEEAPAEVNRAIIAFGRYAY